MAKIKNENNIGIDSFDAEEFSRAIKTLVEQFQSRSQGQKAISSYKPIEEIGAVVRNARKEQKVTLKVLVALSGVSLGTIQKIEKGNQAVSLENLVKILGALGKKIWIQ